MQDVKGELTWIFEDGEGGFNPAAIPLLAVCHREMQQIKVIFTQLLDSVTVSKCICFTRHYPL